MDIEKFTDRARGFLQAASTIAIREFHQQLTPEHLLKALLDDEEGAAAGLIRGGKIRLIAVTSPKRLPSFPDVPTVSETLPGFEASGWYGFVAPAGVPRPIILRLNEEINRALNLPEVRVKILTSGFDVGSYPPDFWAEHIRSEHAKYARVDKAIGFQPE